jgi:hypothetical protein
VLQSAVLGEPARSHDSARLLLQGVAFTIFLVGFALEARDRGVSFLEGVVILVVFVAVVTAVAVVVEKVRNTDY